MSPCSREYNEKQAQCSSPWINRHDNRLDNDDEQESNVRRCQRMDESVTVYDVEEELLLGHRVNDDEDRRIAATKERSPRSKHGKSFSLLLLCTGLSIALFLWALITTRGIRPDTRYNHNITTSTSHNGKTLLLVQKLSPTPNDMVQELGWTETIQHFQVELGKESKALKKRWSKSMSSPTLNIDSLVTLIELMLDTVGVRGVIFGVFNPNLERYHVKDNETEKKEKLFCNHSSNGNHGIGCRMHTIWWLNHYVGATMAEKLVREGKLLVDGSIVQKKYVHTGVEFMTEFHRLQEHVYLSNDHSFHMSHGFVLQYVTMTQPDLQSYPLELTNSFCSQYLGKGKSRTGKGSTKKGIGSECYHSFGHAVFAVVASRQEAKEGREHVSVRTQFVPMGGFQLTDDAICEAYQICYNAPTDVSRAPQKYCHGGFKHSQQLMASKKDPLFYLGDPDTRDKFFAEKFAMCEEKLGLPSSFTMSPSIPVSEKLHFRIKKGDLYYDNKEDEDGYYYDK